MGAITRRCLPFLLAFYILLPSSPATSQAPASAPVLRALLISCDNFLTQPDTAPSSYNNVIALRRALLGDARGYRRVRVSMDKALDADGFRALADDAFLGAAEGDVSLVYISTHGLKGGEDGNEFLALMSDGKREARLSAGDIHQGLEDVPGEKVLILDACFSGAAINKGMEAPLTSSLFTGPDFKVLTSAGGMEPSFLWTDGAGTVRGGSYFAQALVDGLGGTGRFAADANRDGRVTLGELHAHQLIAYGASTPYAYPENDPFTVLEYEPGKPPGAVRPVSGLSLESRVIRQEGDTLDFSYTLHHPSRLAYQLVYEQGGGWRFQAPQSIPEEGVLRPGRKQASLRLQPGLAGLSGYLLLLVITVNEDRAAPQACVLLSVQTGDEDPQLRLDSAPRFNPSIGEEAAFLLRHKGGVEITARVLDRGGRPVAALLHEALSRPLHLQEEGTAIYWNGQAGTGEMAQPGLYRLEVTARAGSVISSVTSGFCELKAPD